MVLAEPAYVVAEREYSAGGDDPRLAHRPAHLLLEAPRLGDELTGTGKRCAGAYTGATVGARPVANAFAGPPARVDEGRQR